MQKFNKQKILKKVLSEAKPRPNPKQLSMGFEVEKEHTDKFGKYYDVVKGDGNRVAKIAAVHLKELPDYYTRLKKMEKGK